LVYRWIVVSNSDWPVFGPRWCLRDLKPKIFKAVILDGFINATGGSIEGRSDFILWIATITSLFPLKNRRWLVF